MNADTEKFLRWLVSMDDPESQEGLEARRTVTLTKIITEARALLPDDEPQRPTPCSECGMTYDACTHKLRRAGGKPCCGTCAYRVTHNQNRWESWRRSFRP